MGLAVGRSQDLSHSRTSLGLAEDRQPSIIDSGQDGPELPEAHLPASPLPAPHPHCAMADNPWTLHANWCFSDESVLWSGKSLELKALEVVPAGTAGDMSDRCWTEAPTDASTLEMNDLPFVPGFCDLVQLSESSHSRVFRCRRESDARVVILKENRCLFMNDAQLIAMQREVNVMEALIGTPGVVQLLDVQEHSSSVFLVLEDCALGDLWSLLSLRGGLRQREAALGVVAPLLRSLVRLHAHGVLHRDLKPENVFLDAQGRVILGDFGLAICEREELPFLCAGTRDYMAPEVLANHPEGRDWVDSCATHGSGVQSAIDCSPTWTNPGTARSRSSSSSQFQGQTAMLAYQPAQYKTTPIDLNSLAPSAALPSPTPLYAFSPTSSAATAPPQWESPCVGRASLAAAGLRAYGPAVDVWAVGVLAYELVVGHPPASSSDGVGTEEPAFPHALVDSAWAAFVRTALTRDPSARPSAAQLLDHPWVRQQLCGSCPEQAERECREALRRTAAVGEGPCEDAAVADGRVIVWVERTATERPSAVGIDECEGPDSPCPTADSSVQAAECDGLGGPAPTPRCLASATWNKAGRRPPLAIRPPLEPPAAHGASPFASQCGVLSTASPWRADSPDIAPPQSPVPHLSWAFSRTRSESLSFETGSDVLVAGEASLVLDGERPLGCMDLERGLATLAIASRCQELLPASAEWGVGSVDDAMYRVEDLGALPMRNATQLQNSSPPVPFLAP